MTNETKPLDAAELEARLIPLLSYCEAVLPQLDEADASDTAILARYLPRLLATLDAERARASAAEIGQNALASQLHKAFVRADATEKRVAELEAVMQGLYEEYRNQWHQFGQDPIWQKYEDKEVIERASLLLAALEESQ